MVVAPSVQTSGHHRLIHLAEVSSPLLIRTPGYSGPKSGACQCAILVDANGSLSFWTGVDDSNRQWIKTKSYIANNEEMRVPMTTTHETRVRTLESRLI